MVWVLRVPVSWVLSDGFILESSSFRASVSLPDWMLWSHPPGRGREMVARSSYPRPLLEGRTGWGEGDSPLLQSRRGSHQLPWQLPCGLQPSNQHLSPLAVSEEVPVPPLRALLLLRPQPPETRAREPRGHQARLPLPVPHPWAKGEPGQHQLCGGQGAEWEYRVQEP